MVKHFFKTLLIFTAMIALGLLGVFLLGGMDKSNDSSKTSNTVEVAK
ncbi:MAG: hypothetical protein WCI93_03400 [bacterium]